MTDCHIHGCRYLQTTCVTCGRIVCEKMLPKRMEWVSVNTLPEEGQTVICFNGMVCTGFYQIDFCPYEKSKQGWNLDLDELERELVGDNEVTHWMSLPEPPKE